MTKRLIRLLFEDPLCRKRFEVERRKMHLFAPSTFLAAARKGHCGQRQIRANRKFGCGQYWGNVILLRTHRQAVAYTHLWVPMGTGFDEPVEYDPESPDAATAAAVEAEKRAKRRAREQAANEAAERELVAAHPADPMACAGALQEGAHQDRARGSP